MATLQAIRERSFSEAPAALSRHEAGCLCVRLAECDELLQVAILGTDEACSKTGDAGDLVAIRCSLELAEAQLAKARALAAQLTIRPAAHAS